MNKPERDKGAIKKVMKVAIEAAWEQTPLVDRLTRLRAAIFWGEEVSLDVSELRELEAKLSERI